MVDEVEVEVEEEMEEAPSPGFPGGGAALEGRRSRPEPRSHSP